MYWGYHSQLLTSRPPLKSSTAGAPDCDEFYCLSLSPPLGRSVPRRRWPVTCRRVGPPRSSRTVLIPSWSLRSPECQVGSGKGQLCRGVGQGRRQWTPTSCTARVPPRPGDQVDSTTVFPGPGPPSVSWSGPAECLQVRTPSSVSWVGSLACLLSYNKECRGRRPSRLRLCPEGPQTTSREEGLSTGVHQRLYHHRDTRDYIPVIGRKSSGVGVLD